MSSTTINPLSLVSLVTRFDVSSQTNWRQKSLTAVTTWKFSTLVFGLMRFKLAFHGKSLLTFFTPKAKISRVPRHMVLQTIRTTKYFVTKLAPVSFTAPEGTSGL